MKLYCKLFSLVIILLVCVMSISGCASPAATRDGMLVNRFVSNQQLSSKSVNVNVVGIYEDAPLHLTRAVIPFSELKSAIESSLVDNQIFSQIVDNKLADYLLTCVIFGMDSKGGGEVTDNIEIAWILKNLKNNETVWKESIKSSKTLSISDEFIGLKRKRLTTENAVRINLKQAILAMSKLSL